MIFCHSAASSSLIPFSRNRYRQPHRITASEVPGNTQPGGFRPIPLRMKHGMEAHELQKVGPHNCNADERVFR
jgi:hypothetical protein